MCGIIAYHGGRTALDVLLEGLSNLDYRGYDSAGVAVTDGAALDVVKREGKLDALSTTLDETRPLRDGGVGIAHTRWSTHGPPTDENAHPHTDCTDRVAVVHNGIVDNHDTLRSELAAAGHSFTSGTDTEVIPHLIEAELEAGHDPKTAFVRAVKQLSGSYAIACMVAGDETIYATRSGSPLVLGCGDGESFLASDVPAFCAHTQDVVYLQDGDFVTLTEDGYTIEDAAGMALDRDVETVDWGPESASKDGHDHYMLKEIAEQATALSGTIGDRADPDAGVTLDGLPEGTFADVEEVHFVAMGTSYHAGMFGANALLGRGIRASAHQAGEYVTTPPPVDEGTLVVAVSQSGETADTLAAVRAARDRGARTLALTNVVGSSLTRVCDDSLFIRAGPEIGVAATKTFSSQVATLLLLDERLVRDIRGEDAGDRELMARLADLPDAVQTTLDGDHARQIADEYADSDAYFFIGRGLGHPVALEGALKMKEISYEHAEGFSAAELKHGPLALVTDNTPVFGVFTGAHTTQTLNNLEEVKARGAPVVVVAPESVAERASFADHVLTFPDTHEELAGVLANVQLQLVSYYTANLLDRPIDKPRNLAKSVTVE